VVAGVGSVRKTSSGKVRRSATRRAYLDGELQPPRRTMAWQLTRFVGHGIGWRGLQRARELPDLVFGVWGWACYALAGLAAVVVVTVVPGERRRRALVYALARSLTRLTATALHVEGAEHLPDGAFVMVANHASYVDSFVMAAIVPDRVSFVAGEVFATQPAIGFVLRRIGVQFVDRGRTTGLRDALSSLAEVVRHGTGLVFFPEGGLSPVVGVRRFHHGAFVVAAEAGVPVVPVALRGTRRLVAPGTLRPRPGRVEVEIGQPIRPVGTGWQAAVDVANRARQVIVERCSEPDVS